MHLRKLPQKLKACFIWRNGIKSRADSGDISFQITSSKKSVKKDLWMSLEQIYQRNYEYLYIRRWMAHGNDTSLYPYCFHSSDCRKSLRQTATIWWSGKGDTVLDWEAFSDFFHGLTPAELVQGCIWAWCHLIIQRLVQEKQILLKGLNFMSFIFYPCPLVHHGGL